MPLATRNLFQDSLVQPEPSEVVWRFMALQRFIELIQTQKLAFARADKMNDKKEGYYSNPTLEAARLEPGEVLTSPTTFGGMTYSLAQLMNLSCWYVSEAESFGMWQVYKGTDQGVGIRTTWGRLTASIDPRSKIPAIFGGKVKYTNYEVTSNREPGGIAAPLFRKRLEFSSEQEARLVIIGGTISDTSGPDREGHYNDVLELALHPLFVDINLIAVVDRVVVAPDTDAVKLDEIQQSILDAGFSWSAQRSSLDQPMWDK